MPSAVERRAEEVVHAAVADRDPASGNVLDVEHPRDERPRRADQPAARLENQVRAQLGRHSRQRLGIGLDGRVLATVVPDPEPTADVELPQCDAGRSELSPELRRFLGGGQDRCRVEQLRADVEGDPYRLERRICHSPLEGETGVAEREAELARRRAGRHVRVRVGGHVRIQPDRDGCDQPERACFLRDCFELAERLDVERVHAGR